MILQTLTGVIKAVENSKVADQCLIMMKYHVEPHFYLSVRTLSFSLQMNALLRVYRRVANGRNLAGLCGLSYKYEILLRCRIWYYY